MHPAIAKLLGAANPHNKRAADEAEGKQRGTLVLPRVTTQPKGPLMIKGEGWASNDRTDTNDGDWTPYPEKIMLIKERQGSIVESNKQAETQASIMTTHKIETIQKAGDRKRLAGEQETQDPNRGIPCKIKREQVRKENEEDEIYNTWEIVPSEELIPRVTTIEEKETNEQVRKPKDKRVVTTEEKEADEQPDGLEGIMRRPPELETRNEGRQIAAENPPTYRTREELKEYWAATGCDENKVKTEVPLGEFDEWMLVENRDYAERKAPDDRLETNKKEPGIVQAKPRDVNVDELTH